MLRDGNPALGLLRPRRAARAAALRLDAGQRLALAEAWRALWMTRLLVWVAGAGAVVAFGISGRASEFDPSGVTQPYGPVGDLLVAPAVRWDSVWFLAIANDGYGHESTRGAFFPLYPLLVKVAGALTGSPLIGGVLVSGVAFLGASYLLHRLTALELGEEAARHAVWGLALFPAAFFFSGVYSEALFLLVSVGAVYAARTRSWAWAGSLAALGAMTRSAGVLLVVPLALLYVRERGWRLRRDALWIAVVPLGLVAFAGVLALAGQDPLTPLHAQEVWLRSFAGPFGGVADGFVAAWAGVRQLWSGARTPVVFTQAGGDPFAVAGHNLVNLAFLLAAVPVLVGVLRRLPAAYGAYVLVALALPLSYPVGPQPLMSLPRFLAVLFPLFMWLGWWLARGGLARRAVVLGVFGLGLAVLTGQFATWHWVA
jgi:hypothetical protein